ncbi:uncharacterized protein LOC143230953 isoform X2 [Tachypleus tridentatus]|uniref:uncharacterized protein LOC143230953 isoform X2 n=1 Tax=Tachypleus tridentatus TaxID=6853 RepID=UPI003FD01DB6
MGSLNPFVRLNLINLLQPIRLNQNCQMNCKSHHRGLLPVLPLPPQVQSGTFGNYISDDASIGKQINAETKKFLLENAWKTGSDYVSPSVVQENCVFSIVGFHNGDVYSTINMQRVLSANTAFCS